MSESMDDLFDSTDVHKLTTVIKWKDGNVSMMQILNKKSKRNKPGCKMM